MPTKGALKLSSKGNHNLQRSKQKVNRLVHTTETNSHSSHPLSRALLLTCFFPHFFFHFHSPFFKRLLTKASHLSAVTVLSICINYVPIALLSAFTLTQKLHKEHLWLRWAGKGRQPLGKEARQGIS